MVGFGDRAESHFLHSTRGRVEQLPLDAGRLLRGAKIMARMRWDRSLWIIRINAIANGGRRFSDEPGIYARSASVTDGKLLQLLLTILNTRTHIRNCAMS